MKKKRFTSVISMFLCACMLFSFSGCSLPGKDDLTADRSIIAENVNGSVLAVKSSGDVSVVSGEKLESGNQIKILEDSDLTMLLDADKHVFAGALTRFNLVAAGSVGSTSTRLELMDGTLVCGIDNKLNPQETFEVATPNALMSVRGTVFTTKVVNNGPGDYSTVLSVSEGSIATTTIEDGEEKTVTVGAGESREFEGESPNYADTVWEDLSQYPEGSMRDIHSITDVNKRFEMYLNGTFTLDTGDDPNDAGLMVAKGKLYKFEDYFTTEVAEVRDQGLGMGYTTDIIVLSQPLTMRDGKSVSVMIAGTNNGGFVSSLSQIPYETEFEFCFDVYLTEIVPPDQDGWVDLDYRVFGSPCWECYVFDHR